MTKPIISLIIIVLLLLLVAVGYYFYSKKSKNPLIIKHMQALYNHKVKFTKGTALEFPDFGLVYKGTTLIPGPNNAPWSMTVYNFDAIHDSEVVNVSWSSGAGLITAQKFTINGKTFWIEKAYSETLGDLANDELVIIAQ